MNNPYIVIVPLLDGSDNYKIIACDTLEQYTSLDAACNAWLDAVATQEQINLIKDMIKLENDKDNAL